MIGGSILEWIYFVYSENTPTIFMIGGGRTPAMSVYIDINLEREYRESIN
ncbi:hypothetical protein MTBBW1_2500028 [Desulfamplus magnetovallimortis]|uniref:Uncharacterized protein n=1 Tax=Desulfamplus magnetovallimortis TaxID=1246637 RepID=A0A1W1HEG4_9BACT|nr:hypothetical protein MTBBW1_2500028 [Desulfamplus magnetovallimortis]